MYDMLGIMNKKKNSLQKKVCFSQIKFGIILTNHIISLSINRIWITSRGGGGGCVNRLVSERMVLDGIFPKKMVGPPPLTS